MTLPLIEMRNITKKFPGVIANDQINLKLYAGQIHALLGENASGKSVLTSILSGLYTPTEGQILINGEERFFASPKDAIDCGIGMVHQHFKLVESFTVLENILLAQQDCGFFVPKRTVSKRISELAAKYSFNIDPEAFIWQLSVGEKQQVEILKVLYYNSKVLILDEPTAVLTPQESRELFINLRKMAQEGCAVVFITHKLNEVLQVSDCVTVLRGGKMSGFLPKEKLNHEILVEMMVGREILNTYEKPAFVGDIVLQLEGIKALNNMQAMGLKNLNLQVRAGQIYCIAGVSGNGQRELAEVVAGLRPIISGKLFIDNTPVDKISPKKMIDMGVSFVPDDRLGVGLVPNMDSCENIILKQYNTEDFSGKLMLKSDNITCATETVVEKYDVKLSSIYKPVRMMSGGNQQKLLLAREIMTNPKIMVVMYPSRGLDIGAIESVHKLFIQLKEQNTALVIISEDLDEIAKLADTVGVIFDGQIVGEFPAQNMDLEKIGLLMSGVIKEEAS